MVKGRPSMAGTNTSLVHARHATWGSDVDNCGSCKFQDKGVLLMPMVVWACAWACAFSFTTAMVPAGIMTVMQLLLCRSMGLATIDDVVEANGVTFAS